MRCVVAFALCSCALIAAERPQVLITTSLGEITAELFAAQAPETVATFIALAEGEKAWKDPATGASVTRPFYDGLAFHRVIDGFMIQGGCPLGNGQGGPGFSFADEINARSLGLEDEKVIVGDQPNPQCAYMWPQIQQAIIAPALSAKGMGPQTPREQLQPAVMAEVEKLRSMSLRQLYERLGYTYRDDLPPSTRPLKGHLAMANSGPGTNGSQFFINLTDTPHLTGKHTVFGKVVAGLEVVEKIGAVATGPGDKPSPPVVIESIRLVEGE